MKDDGLHLIKYLGTKGRSYAPMLCQSPKTSSHVNPEASQPFACLMQQRGNIRAHQLHANEVMAQTHLKKPVSVLAHPKETHLALTS